MSTKKNAAKFALQTKKKYGTKDYILYGSVIIEKKKHIDKNL